MVGSRVMGQGDVCRGAGSGGELAGNEMTNAQSQEQCADQHTLGGGDGRDQQHGEHDTQLEQEDGNQEGQTFHGVVNECSACNTMTQKIHW